MARKPSTAAGTRACSMKRPGEDRAAPSRPPRDVGKVPFDPEVAMPLLREAVKDYPKTAMFELHDEGHTSVFEVLAACIISVRTLEEVTLPTSRRLFATARRPVGVTSHR